MKSIGTAVLITVGVAWTTAVADSRTGPQSGQRKAAADNRGDLIVPDVLSEAVVGLDALTKGAVASARQNETPQRAALR